VTRRDEVLDHAVRLFPVPEDGLTRLYERRARRQRQRRAVVVATVVALWAAIALILVVANDDRGSVPVTTPSVTKQAGVTTLPVTITESDELPSTFPNDVPLPDGVVPVASYTSEDTVTVWFSSESSPRALQRFYQRELAAAGWTSFDSGSVAGVWEERVTSDGRSATLLGKESGATRLIHGSDVYDGEWDLFIHVGGV